MNKLTKWIILSLHNALFLYLFFLPELNFYRIARLTGWASSYVLLFTKTLAVLIVVSMTITLYWLTKKYFYEKPSAYLLSVSWIPFYYILIKLNAFIIPITEAGDDPAPVTGLLIMASWVAFPLYIFIIVTFALFAGHGEKQQKEVTS